jgi:hypothetical protein
MNKSTFRKSGAKKYNNMNKFTFSFLVFAPLFLKVEKVEKVEQKNIMIIYYINGRK